MKKRLSKLDENQEISIRLEQYDDIFSDFDMRPFGKRALSVDFLDEIRRASVDKNMAGVELFLCVPEKERSESNDVTIKERLVGHFSKHYKQLVKEKRATVGRGVVMVIIGMIFMVVATYIVYESSVRHPLITFLAIFLEPTGLFSLWEGLDQIIFNSKQLNPELNFYKKMAHDSENIHFKSY